jgi:hypothetical protein
MLVVLGTCRKHFTVRPTVIVISFAGPDLMFVADIARVPKGGLPVSTIFLRGSVRNHDNDKRVPPKVVYPYPP